jgi:hypothetical protein
MVVSAAGLVVDASLVLVPKLPRAAGANADTSLLFELEATRATRPTTALESFMVLQVVNNKEEQDEWDDVMFVSALG